MNTFQLPAREITTIFENASWGDLFDHIFFTEHEEVNMMVELLRSNPTDALKEIENNI